MAQFGTEISVKIRNIITAKNVDIKVGHENVSTTESVNDKRFRKAKKVAKVALFPQLHGLKSKHTRVASDAEIVFFHRLLSINLFRHTLSDFAISN